VDGHAFSIQIDAKTAKDPDKPSRQAIAEIEGQIAYIDRVNMRIVPKAFDVESAKYFYLEHVCATEVHCPYRFAEAERIQTVHRDFFPSIVYDITKSSQLHRYQFAGQFAKNGNVLNLFCGDPDGPRILSSKARAVTGVSSDDALIGYSKAICNSPSMNFTRKLIDETNPKNRREFDAIVCFLDFTSLSEIRKLIPHLSNVLKKGGTAILSIPNTLNGADSIYHWDRYYFEPFSLDNLKEILSNNFTFLYWYWQEIYPSFRITPFLLTENPLMNRGCFDQDYAPKPYSSDSANDISHFVVVCSQIEIDNSAITGNDFSPGHKYCIEKADSYIHSVKSIVNEVRTIISQRDSKIQDMATSVAEVQAALKHIHDSNGWKFLTKYYKIRDVLLPQASFRRRILEALWNLRIK
jgi:SAM-dependent methyltransferase